MERDVRYMLVGIVLAVLMAALVGVGIWQARHFGDPAGAAHYTLFVNTSASGLGSGSAVRYMGVRVGRVERLRLAKEDAQRVEVDITVRRRVPITAATVASIQPQGVTGQSIVALRTPDANAGAPPQPPGAPFPVIATEPATFDRILAAAPDLMERFDKLLSDARALLDADNRAQVGRTLRGAAELTDRLDTLIGRLNGLAKRGDETLSGLDRAIAEVRRTASVATAAFAETEVAAEAVERLSDRLDGVLKRNEGAIDRFAQRSLPAVDPLIRDASRTIEALRQLIDRLRERPSQLIRSRPEGGMEVPR